MAEVQIVSYSELDTLRQCLFKHEQAYKQRWVPPRVSPALARGTLWHTVMQAHYTAIQAWQIQMAKRKASGRGRVVPIDEDKDLARKIWNAVKVHLYDQGGQQTEEQALVEWMYRGYIELYGLDSDWDILAVEHREETPLLDARGRKTRFVIKAKMDLIVRERSTRNVYIVDHKTAGNLPSDKMLDIDDQFSLYAWIYSQVGKRYFGLLHNCARTQRNKTTPQTLESRHLRKRLTRSEEELRTIALDAYRAVKHAWSIPIGQAPRSPNIDTCKWRCDYSEACLLSRKGRDIEQVLKVTGFRQDFTRH